MFELGLGIHADSGPCTLTSSSTTGDHEFTREGVGGSQDTSAVSALNKAIEVINQDGSTTEEYCAIKLSEREDGVRPLDCWAIVVAHS